MDQIYFGNSLWGYTWFAGWIIGALILRKIVPFLVLKLLHKVFSKHLYGIPFERLRATPGKALGNFILVALLYVAVQYLDFPASWGLVSIEEFGLRKVLFILYEILFGIALTIVFLRLADILSLIILRKYEQQEEEEEKEENKSIKQLIPFATDFTKLVIAVIAALVILSTVFNVNIGAIVAGLGIGGIAVALAAKETLENLLGSFIIYMDKPFEIGDFIKLNDTFCTVEKVGFRSSRLRTLQQSRLTVPNKMLVESSIDNYTLRTSRRVDRIIQLSRGSSYSQITGIIEDLKKYIVEHEKNIGDSYVNFHEISSSSLDIRLQYYLDTDWDGYLKILSDINLQTLKIIEEHGTTLAFPTRTLRMNDFPETHP